MTDQTASTEWSPGEDHPLDPAAYYRWPSFVPFVLRVLADVAEGMTLRQVEIAVGKLREPGVELRGNVTSAVTTLLGTGLIEWDSDDPRRLRLRD